MDGSPKRKADVVRTDSAPESVVRETVLLVCVSSRHGASLCFRFIVYRYILTVGLRERTQGQRFNVHTSAYGIARIGTCNSTARLRIKQHCLTVFLVVFSRFFQKAEPDSDSSDDDVPLAVRLHPSTHTSAHIWCGWEGGEEGERAPAERQTLHVSKLSYFCVFFSEIVPTLLARTLECKLHMAVHAP